MDEVTIDKETGLPVMDNSFARVVRCKDCRWQNTPMCWIKYRKLLDDYDFCCGGIRREDEETD